MLTIGAFTDYVNILFFLNIFEGVWSSWVEANLQVYVIEIPLPA